MLELSGRTRGDGHARFADFHCSGGCARSTVGSPSDVGPNRKRLAGGPFSRSAVVVPLTKLTTTDLGACVESTKGILTLKSISTWPHDAWRLSVSAPRSPWPKR